MQIQVTALVGNTTHPAYGRLVEDKEYTINVEHFGDKIFKPKSKKDEAAVNKYLASLEPTEEKEDS